MKLWLIEDDPIMGQSLLTHLRGLGFATDWHVSGMSAVDAAATESPDVVICDIRLPDMTGEDLFLALRGRCLGASFIVITAFGTVEQAVRMVKEGVEDYLTKPFEMSALVDKIERLLKRRRDEQLVHELISDLRERMGSGKIALGVSPQMLQIEQTIKKVCSLNSTLLITGETGTGKEVVASLCHYLSSRAQAPFVRLNCSAFPSTLLESELFGYEKGAFTSADRRKIGKLEAANGGTLFLDEIGELSNDVQVKLLRVLQEREFERLGGNVAIPLNVRLLTATHRDMREAVRNGSIREDFYYRINVVEIHLPALRERHDDILLFARYFLECFTTEQGKSPKSLSPSAEHALMMYHYPGNIRELRNMVERALALSEREILGPEDFFPGSACVDRPVSVLKSTAAIAERDRIIQTLINLNYSRGTTAEALGISRKSLWEKIKRYGIQIPRVS